MKQEEYFGFGSIERLEKIIRDNQPHKIFLVTGKHSYELCGAKRMLDALLKNYDVIHFNDLDRIPTIESLEKGVKIFKEEKCDFIVAVGGGSVIDTAKLANILALNNGELHDYLRKNRKFEKPGRKLVAIPTTAGSGSEATHFAVVYVRKKKFSVADGYLLPSYSILDPQFTLSLPPKTTASSGLDAMSQAIESYWSISSTKVSRKLAKAAIQIILRNLVTAVKKPTRNCRLAMLRAANLAGKAINMTKTTGPHALSYSLTSHFGIAHGHAVGLTLGEFFIHNSSRSSRDNVTSTGTETHQDRKKIMNELVRILGISDALAARDKIDKLMHDIGLETRLSSLKIRSKADIDKIINGVDLERLANNPKVVTRKDVRGILMSIF